MRWNLYYPFLLACYILKVYGAYTIQCNNPQSATSIQNAINEAIKVAANALARIQTPEDAIVVAAFKPLFILADIGNPTAPGTLSYLYARVTQIVTDTSMAVTFYCDENHVQWSDPRNGWMDTAYKYTAANGEIKSVTQYKLAGGTPSVSPGAKGSYSSLGYQIQLISDIADCSNQGHIYVWSQRIDPLPNDNYDHRSLDTINAQGINPQFAALDNIKPLSETILHELMHIYGGLQNPTSGVKMIRDIWNGVRIRGYKACVTCNADRATTKITPLQAADPAVILAKALYLQPKTQPPMYWDTGAVDVGTGAPAGLPGPSAGGQKRGVVWIA